MSDIRYENQTILNVDLDKEMRKSFIDYAMSVLTARALPDVRDGLKPVHRRILYAMWEDNLTSERPYRKSATTVGNVLGRYHPHGDSSVYDAMVRMAQSFSLRYPLVDGHGNFGSVDGDPPAAYRYTEARMAKLSNEMMADIDKETVPFSPNFDDKLKEPDVVPARFPNLLANGSQGIAVGMATNIPPHNLCEIIDAVCCVIDNPEAGLEDICQYIKGPDFPTGGIIMGRSGIRAAYATGKGKLLVRARAEVEEWKDGRYRIAITEIPWMVNKARLVEAIADLHKDKRVDGITDLRDESDRTGMRVVVELRRDANPQVVLNQLYKYTQLQDTFAVNMLALTNGQPKVMNLREMLDHYIEHQFSVVTNRTTYDLRKAQERAHLLEGLAIACDNIDEVIRIIRQSYDNAKERLMDRFGIDEVQAQAILEMQLRRLQGLEREKIENELNALHVKIADYEDILQKPERVYAIIKEELQDIRRKYGDARRTEISHVENEIDIEDLIDDEMCVFTMTSLGYIKRLPATEYAAQGRGGTGKIGLKMREEDAVDNIFTASTHDNLLFFTSYGRVYKLKGYQIPESSKTAKGMNIVNLLPVAGDEKVTAGIRIRDFDERYAFFTTRNGTVKRVALQSLNTARKAGVRAITLDEGDVLINVRITDGNDHIVLATRQGKGIRFHESEVRAMGRDAGGVRGIRLQAGDEVIGAAKERAGALLLTVTENGYGKLTDPAEYRECHRGGQGVTAHDLTDKTGALMGIKFVVPSEDDILLISSDGKIIRTNTDTIRVCGRASQGVRLIRMEEGSAVISFARTPREEQEDESGEEGEETAQPAEAEAETEE